jgi:glycosyltransferase involved in cell wall biosynthesis
VPQIPRADVASGDRRLDAMLEFLARECEVTLVSLASRLTGVDVYEQRLRDLQVRLIGYGGRRVLYALARYAFDVVFFEFHFTASAFLPYVRAVQPQASVVVDSVDLHFLRERAGNGNVSDAPERDAAAQAELTVYRQAELTVAVTDEERLELAEHEIGNVVLIPNIVPIVPRSLRVREAVVLFIGGFRHPPNVDAVLWFERCVWPSVLAQVPEARWRIIGSAVPPEVLALNGPAGIDVVGFVTSTAPFLEEAQVSIAPLTYGAGMKGKVSEALAAGVPVVTTQWGAQGFSRGRGEAFLVADDATAFASAVVQVLTDPGLRARLSTAGPAVAREFCSIDAAIPGLRAIVDMGLRSAQPSSGTLRILRLIRAVLVRRWAKFRYGVKRPV